MTDSGGGLKVKIAATSSLLMIVLSVSLLWTGPAECKDGVITAKEGKLSRSISRDFSGFNGNVVLVDGAWTDVAFIGKVKELLPGNLRFPAGTVANYWDWREGWFVEGWDLPHGWNNTDMNSNKLEGFKPAIDATGAAPVWDLNVLSSSLKEQLAMLREAEKLGFEIQYVELGNEMYLDWDDYVKRFPTPASYGKLAKRWCKRIKKEFPKALVAVIGTAPLPDDNRPRVKDWNSAVLKKTKAVADAITMHPYAGSGLAREDEFTDPVVPLSVPFVNWEGRRAALDTLPKGMEVWITEYNMLESTIVVSETWTHGLYAATTMFLMMEEKQITLLCNHNIASTKNGAIYTRHGSYAFSPNGVVMRIIHTAMAGKKRAQKLEFSQQPIFKDARGDDRPALLGWLFYKGGGPQMVLLNISPKTLKVDVDGVFGSGKVGFELISGDPLKKYTDSASLKWSLGKTKGKINLQPYSIARIYELP